MNERQKIILRKYLSPTLRDMLNSADELDRALVMMRMTTSRGLIPPSKMRSKIIVLTEKLISDILQLVKRKYRNEKDKTKEFEKNIQNFVKSIGEYKDKLIGISLVGETYEIIERTASYLETYSAFLDTFIYPLFERLAVQISLSESPIWDPQEKTFASFAFDRSGIEPPKEEPERERR